MVKIEAYRRFAADSVNRDARSADFRFKAILIGMAGAWLKLADKAEKNSRADLVYETPSQSRTGTAAP